MAQLVLTYVGNLIAGPIGAAVGAYIGASLEGDPPTQYGPRLDDLKVTTSAYGINRPRHFGTGRTAGNVIYAQPLHEVETATDVGGKGGPTQTTITYSYFATFAVSLGHGIGRGVRRIWANGVLVWDATIGASNPDAIALDFTFYPGTPDQLPDPTMEADIGVGMVPGYRDDIVVMFREVPLEKFGNRLPSLDLELTMDDGEWGATAQTTYGSAAAHAYTTAVQSLDGSVIAVARVDGSTLGLTAFDPATGEVLTSSTYARTMGLTFTTSCLYVPPTNEVWVPQAGIGAGYDRFNASTLAFVGTTETIYLAHAGGAYYDAGLRCVIGLAGVSLFFGYQWTTYGLGGAIRTEAAPDIVTACDYLIGGGSVVCVGYVPAAVCAVFAIADIAPARQLATFASGDDCRGVVYDPTRNRYIALTATGVWTVEDSLTPTPTEYTPAGYSPGIITAVRYVGGLDVVQVYSSVGATAIVSVLDAETLDVLYQGTVGSTTDYAALPGVFASSQSLPGIAFGIGSSRPWSVDLYGTTYATAVRSLCLVSDELDSGDIDVSGLGQRLLGFTVAQGGPVRDAIEQLGRADFFDGVEVDDVIKFPRRGGATVATITLDECGAALDQATEHASAATRAQELDLPAHLFITSVDPYTDFQPGTQYAERLAQAAGSDETERYAIVMSATMTKRLADARLFDRWASRESGAITVGRRHTRIMPADPVVLDGRRVRVVSRADEGGVIRFEWVADDADVITQLALGAQGAFSPQTVAVNVPTSLIVLDLALLRDGDNSPGGYMAAWGLPPYWRGMSLFASADGGVTYAAKTTLGAPGTSTGTTTTALGDWTGGNRFDEANTVTVHMINGALSSVTRAQVLGGANGVAIEGPDGWEVLQFRTAVLNGDGSYTLSGLLRGRRGTEWATAGHAIGNRLIVLDSSTMRSIGLDAADLGAPRMFKPVTVGDTLSATTAQTATIDGERLKPFSPVDLRALRDVASGDITLTWRRRTRLSYRFLAEGIAAPLGEASEAYVVTIWTDNTYTTVKRTIAASTNTAAYSSANQTADFGSNQATVYATVTQTSATVGAGHELRAAA